MKIVDFEFRFNKGLVFVFPTIVVDSVDETEVVVLMGWLFWGAAIIFIKKN